MDLANILSVGYWGGLWAKHGDQVVGSAGKTIVIVVAYVFVRFLVLRLVGRLSASMLVKAGGELMKARKARVKALQSVISSTVAFVLGFVAMIMVLQAAGINIVPLLTTASVAGLAVGFGAQKLVRDVIAGVFILAEDQYGVGDYVTIGGVSGVIEELSMRITRIRDNSGKLTIIANGDIAQVCNHSRGRVLETYDVSVPTTADLEDVVKVLNEVGLALAEEMPAEVKTAFQCDGLTQISGASNTIRLAGSVRPGSLDEVRSRLNFRIREAFAEHGLTLA